MMAMDSQALVKLGPSIPESLGNFHLDDHNVVEWSDSNIPGLRHKARKETGKWVNPINNADIQYQKHEDCTHSTRGKEQTRTEVISGQAPDSTFQIVRSRTQVHDSGNDNFNSRVQSSSTSYQMNSSIGVRSTSKSTSNRTKTVTVSGGRSTDDFEHLGLMFQPLDTSTQRERINVSRSGTMGVRRPPTRRHTPATPAPIVSTSPDDSEVEIKDEIIVDSDDNLRNSPEMRNIRFPEHHQQNHKDISSKIRVGFPVEIQLELQNKFRNSSRLERNGGLDSSDDPDMYRNGMKDTSYQTVHKKQTETMEHSDRTIGNDSVFSSSLFGAHIRHKDNNNFDFNQRRKSYELESRTKHSNENYTQNYTKPLPYSDNHFLKSPRNSPSPKPWERASNEQQTYQKEESRPFVLPSSSIFKKFNAPYERDSFETKIPIQVEQFPFKKTVVNLHIDEDSELESKYFNNENYMVTPTQLNHKDSSYSNNETERLGYYVTDVKTPSPTPPSFPPSLERSRLLQMLEETPNILPFNPNKSSQTEEIDNWSEDIQEIDWEAQRQLSFLNDSLSRILEGGSSGNKMNNDQDALNEEAFYNTSQSRRISNNFEDFEADINGNFRNKSQVSQTWISSGDEQKPSQKARDNDVTTSISTIHDHLKRGQKKVEFCKTEVHFTADSGKFHIVETDENKPSTTHLFRKKKRDRAKQSILAALESINAKSKAETNNNDISSSKLYTDEKTTQVESEGQNVEKQQWPYNRQHTTAESDKNESNSGRMPIIDSLKSSPTLTLYPFNEGESRNQLQPSSFLHQDDDTTRILDVTHSNSFNSLGTEQQPMSHTILEEEYEEMKIQRYLNHLKSPSSSSHPNDSQVFNFDPEDKSSTFRFNNVLYENGSFVPFATRQSLIEMNNNNKNSRLSEDSEVEKKGDNPYFSDNSLNSQPIRLARMEATVATARSNPQITSVELRYEFDNEGNEQELDKYELFSHSQPTQYHSLNSMKEDKLDQTSYRSSDKKVGKSETPTYSSRAGRISDMIKRSYYKNPICGDNSSEERGPKSQKELSMSASTISSTNNNKEASKSIVTIGDYDSSRNAANKSIVSSPEPMLSMDHTWKGPAYVGTSNNLSKTSQELNSLTLPKFVHNEPEWVSKARIREKRVTDWDAIGKQSVHSAPSQPEQPPWIEDIIRKPSYGDKTVPKVSVVYPWQRSTKSPERVSLYSENEQGQSHIVSLVPSPPPPPPLFLFKSEQRQERLHHSRGPKSLSDLPTLESSKNASVIKSSETILASSTSLKNEGKTTKTVKRSLPDFPPTSSSSQSTTKLGNEVEKSSKSQIGHKSSGTVGHNPVVRKANPVGSKWGKDKQVLSTVKETRNVMRGGSGVDQKSVKSFDSAPTSTRQRKKAEEIDSSSPQSSVQIHRHPLVKVSKLPIRNKPPSKPTEGRSIAGLTTKSFKLRSKENQTVADDSGKSSGRKKGVSGGKMDSLPPQPEKSESQPWRRK